MTINRRDALRTLGSAAIGAAASPLWVDSLTALAREQAHAHAAGQTAAAVPNWAPKILSAPQNELVIAISELIIPETDTPGAKGAHVNRFIDGVLADAVPGDRDSFIRGLTWIDDRSRALSGKGFVDASPADQTALLTRLSAEGNPDREDRIGTDFFQAIKSMTIDGYYTSEIGLRQELGDSGQLFLPEFPGCNHPEHQ